MAGKNRLLAKLLSSSSDGTVVPDSDILSTNVSKTLTSSVGIQTYANIDLLPSSAETGEKALVLTTNRLYIYNNGWYNIAIINNFNPQWITQPSGSYTLNNDGTSTTITVLASDSDDVPITYTAVTNSGFDSIATITHDSDKHNVWTITPIDSDNGTQSAGSGTVTFKASDGVNLVQAVSSFDITFVVSNNRYTTMLLEADSDGNDNQIDASPSGRAITEVGNVKSTAFTPYHPGGYSGWSYGTGGSSDVSYLVPLGVNDSATFGNGDFTIESWVYTFSTTKQQVLFDQRPASTTGDYVTILTTGGQLRVYMQTADVIAASVNTAIAANVWVHVAIVRHNSVLKMYIDGVEKGSVTSNHNISSTPTSRPVIARNGHGTGYAWNGYLSDFRIVKSAVYTSAFTPPTERLTAISNTSLLLYTGEPYLEDKSTNNWPLQWSTNHGLKRFSRFDYSNYRKSVHGGSVYWDGNGDQLQAANSNDLDPGSGDMTWEFWCYPTTTNANSTIACRWHITQGRSWLIYNYTSDRVGITFKVGGSQYSCGIVMSMKNTWNHVAIVKNASDNTTKIWVNGKLKNSIGYGSSTWLDSTGPMSIGFNLDNAPASWYYGGYIQDFNMTKRALYTDSEIPVPTSPVTLDSDCKISTSTNRHYIYDIAGGYRHGQSIITPASALAVEGFAKFANEDSIKFDGTTNSYLRVGLNYHPLRWMNDDELSSGTFEAWIYQTAQETAGAVNTAPCILGWGGTYLNFGINNTQLRFYYWTGSTNTIDPSGATISANTWHHVAFTNDSSNNLRIFLDGTLVHTISSFAGVAYASASNGEYIYLGTESQNVSSRFTGYIYNARITKGLARYTANFTPPTSKLIG